MSLSSGTLRESADKDTFRKTKAMESRRLDITPTLVEIRDYFYFFDVWFSLCSSQVLWRVFGRSVFHYSLSICFRFFSFFVFGPTRYGFAISYFTSALILISLVA
ncbi:hypothetical protein CPC08DRAFT_90444 [Agrocybe pediades]|nr:hypothetical protein CPC08DRAFT_90444 [Agrocybe pediades]